MCCCCCCCCCSCPQDPFFEQSLDLNSDHINRVFKKFVPLGYDVYVFGVQEAVSDSVFDAFAK